MAGDRALQRTQQSKIPPEARRLIDFLNSQRRGEKPDGHAFYNATRSQTQRWHSYAVCGNRSNVATYRRRGDRA